MAWKLIPAGHAQLAEILRVISEARGALARLGTDQWQDGYPEPDIIEDDIALGVGYVLMEAGVIHGYMVLAPSPEEAYAELEGEWLTDGAYITVHRLCLDDAARGHGHGEAMLRAAEAIAREKDYPALRADTHRGNILMQHLLDKRGFARCGTVRYPVRLGDPLRIAYEKPLD